jgi:signal transduction histidine kinase
MIRRNVELEARLIDDLLDLTRVANGKLRLSLETVDVHEVIDSVLELFRSEIQVKQQDVHVEKHAQHHYVLADRARLQQMLWNLIRNAAKFTPDGGHIYVRTSRRAHAYADLDRGYRDRYRTRTDRQALQCVRAGQPEHDAAVRWARILV